MLHQENGEVFVRRHTAQLVCGNPRGTDNGRASFLPDRCQIAVCQKDEQAGLSDEELAADVHPLEGNASTYPFNAAIASSWMSSGVKEELTVDHSKRPASDDMVYMVDCKRLRHEDHVIPEMDHYTLDVDEDVREYRTNLTCGRSFDPPAYESEESDGEGVDSPVHFSLAHTYGEDNQCSPNFYRRDEIISSLGLRPTRKPVPIGPNHQAELPECRSSGSESHFMDQYSVLSSPSHICYNTEQDDGGKWIRNSVMSMPGSSALTSTLKPVYRKADCDCIDEDSINCVRKHVSEARQKLEAALGPVTFKELGFCDMGEAVASRWTEEEEHLFQEVVSSNPASLGRNFWDELPLAFPSRTNKELVSYYFNVFMLRKRALQNRFDPMNVDSDDDEWQVSDDDQFAITRRGEKDFPLESLTDQDDAVCNQLPLEGNIYEESDEEDELDYARDHAMSFMDHSQQIFRFDADVQDDSCTSFESQQVGVVDKTSDEFAEDHYRDDGFGGVAEHGYFGSHCDPKAWEIGFTSGQEKYDFLSTNHVIEEVFGKGSCGNENYAASGQEDII